MKPNLVQQIRTLNFTDDSEVERCIQAIEQVAVDRKARERDVAGLPTRCARLASSPARSCSRLSPNAQKRPGTGDP